MMHTLTTVTEPSTLNLGDISRYRAGSAREFPYRTIRMLGAAQLITAVLLLVITVIQVALGYGDRFVLLAACSVNVWTPLPAIAAGITGLCVSEKRYWDTQCMKVAYLTLSLLTGGVFMVILLLVTGIVQSHYYDLSSGLLDEDQLIVPTAVWAALQDTDTIDRKGAQKALIGGIIALALLELIISFVAVFILCYCAPTYSLKDKAMERRLFGAHDPRIQLGTVGNSDVKVVSIINS